MPHQVDSYRFVKGVTRRVVETWINLEPKLSIPWTPLKKPIQECVVSLLTTGGIALKSDRPFNQQGEKQNPWWGDPSYRILSKNATEADIDVYHLHIDPEPVRKDINCLLPLQRLQELELAGEIGSVAPSHYSVMGYQLRPEAMLRESISPIIERLKSEKVDILILIPA